MATQLNQNTTELQAILDAVNALPDAGGDPVLQEKAATPTTAQQEITPDADYDGLSKVTVEGDTNLVPDNIKSGISIFGVDGAFEGSGGDDGSFKAVIERTAVNPTLPSDLTSIGQYAFYGCESLALTELPAGVTSIGYSAFATCTKLALTELPAGVTSLESNVFSYCGKLALTELPAGVTNIAGYALSYCGNLALTELPAGVTNIGTGAFKNCKGLTSITFNGTPTSVSSSAFSGCTNLTTINVPWAEGEVANAPWGATNATINYNYGKEQLATPEIHLE